MPRRRSIVVTALSAAVVAVVSAAIVAVISVAASLSFGLAEARADSGVPIPAEAGSEWEIAAGYNTFSHSDADAQDPHAIDLVRLDSDSAGSAVLSPTTGTVSYSSNDCLVIQDAAGMGHLLCHIQPAAGLYRGTGVAIGERVGTVWHAGYGNNGGIAHIHYAVHHSDGGGHLGRTVPFTGPYSIEGRELFDDTSYNQHAGTPFTSTNRPGWDAGESAESTDGDSGDQSSAQVDDLEEDPETASETAAATPEPRPVSTVTGGWRSFAIERDTTVGALWSRRGGTLTALFYWDRQTQSWRSFHPGLPGSDQVARIELTRGDAILGKVQEGVAWLPRTRSAPTPPTLELTAGLNLVSWHSPDAPLSDALAGLSSVVSAFLWDNELQRYLVWHRDGPDFINSLETVTSGGAIWIKLEHPETWTQFP